MKEESTKDKLLSKAIELFGKNGVAGVSIRELANAAKVNISSVSYHFSGKEGLLDACITHMINYTINKYTPYRQQLQLMISSKTKDINLWKIFFKQYLHVMISSVMEKEYRSRYMLFLREQLSDSKYGKAYFEKAMKPIKHDISQIIRILSPDDTQDTHEIKVLNVLAMSNFMFNTKNFASKYKDGKYLSEEFINNYIDYIVKTITDQIRLQGLSFKADKSISEF